MFRNKEKKVNCYFITLLRLSFYYNLRKNIFLYSIVDFDLIKNVTVISNSSRNMIS